MKRKGPTTLGETQHRIQARDVYRHKPLPALEAEQERQVLDEFRQLERVTNALRSDLEDIQGGSGVDRKAESIPGSGQTIEAAVNAHTFVDAHADAGVIVVDKSTLLTIGYDNVAYEYVGPTEVEVGAGAGPGTWPKYTTNATDWIATSSNDHKILADRDAADQHPQTAIGGRSGHANLELDQNSQDSRISALEAASGAGDHNDLSGRSAINAHPMAAITGLQTGGSTTLFLNANGTYTTPSGFTGNHNDLPGLSAPDAHPMASITGLQTGGSTLTFLNANGTYTVPPGFTGDHNDLPGLTASNAHPLASITGIQTGGSGDAWLDNRGQYSAPPSGGAADSYGYFYVPMHEFAISDTITTPFKSPTRFVHKGTTGGAELSYEMLHYPNDPTAVRATAIIPVPQDYALNGALKIRMVWWVTDGNTYFGQKAAFFIQAAMGGYGLQLNQLTFNETSHLLTVDGDDMIRTPTYSVIPYQNDYGASSPWNGQLLFLTASRWAGHTSDTLTTNMDLASFYVQYPRVTTPSSVWT